eukprot:CAMPEP_0204437282 /NCGR_PEP_ID=MMETSP0470-20130426/77131_1 /ASSEMBLY_ACC=CAM_ASM_000385 /TAXON_ID=2969 /ORGANISM="Oxyrrhis marina" /LENGTH=50 /DNA_ID=CAMNT_0051436007 /DNA_START=1 /DNA_END=153 /DNA_ORIENTATION=-
MEPAAAGSGIPTDPDASGIHSGGGVAGACFVGADGAMGAGPMAQISGAPA